MITEIAETIKGGGKATIFNVDPSKVRRELLILGIDARFTPFIDSCGYLGAKFYENKAPIFDSDLFEDGIRGVELPDPWVAKN